MKIGLIREGKTPPDTRVVLTPNQCKNISQINDIDVVVQPSTNRCFIDEEYKNAGINLNENIQDCEVLLGVKEVPINQLIPNKTYCFFSHTIKEQPYNQKLLKAVVDKNIRLIDYECLVNSKGQRIIAFGHWAGVVGAHNALWTWSKKYQQFSLPRAVEVDDLVKLKALYKTINFPPIKIAVTGGGRVAKGVFEILDAANIKKVSTKEFLNQKFNEAVYTQLDSDDLYARKTDNGFLEKEFFTQPELYKCKIQPYLSCTDLFINAIYWNPDASPYWSLTDMQANDFNIKVIADITCDIAPEASIPSTIKPSTIAKPVYGFDVNTLTETIPFKTDTIDVMAIDNLPNELPRDASKDFGDMFINNVLAEFLEPESEMLHKATIAINGNLNAPYKYLSNYLNGKTLPA